MAKPFTRAEAKEALKNWRNHIDLDDRNRCDDVIDKFNMALCRDPDGPAWYVGIRGGSELFHQCVKDTFDANGYKATVSTLGTMYRIEEKVGSG